jgi:peptidoglycan/xylan/chitin deacetylase (PgdA/CDA1 family)
MAHRLLELPARLWRRVFFLLRDAPKGRGWRVDVATWNEQYRSGYWKFLDGPEEIEHYRAIREWVEPGASVLDMGCGHGRLYELLRECRPARYLGVDVSEEAIRQARRFEEATVSFETGDFETWLPSTDFDVIVFNECLSYATRPLDVLRRFAARLTQGGRTIVSLSHYGNHREIWRSFETSFEVIESRMVENERGQRWDVRVLQPRGRGQTVVRDAFPPGLQEFSWENEKRSLVGLIERGHVARVDARARRMGLDVPILMYHHLEDRGDSGCTPSFTLPLASFERQLDIIQNRGFQTISFADLRSMVSGKRPHTGREVLVTFDDGYESFRRLAVPTLVRHGMTATVFVVVGELGGINRWDVGEGIERRDLMSADGLREVQEAGMTVGVHGWAHRDLMACSPTEREAEIYESKVVLERILGRPVGTFCYPYGRHAATLFGDLERAGYHEAVTIFSDEPHVTSNQFVMRRVYVQPKDGATRFKIKLSRAYLRYVARRGIPSPSRVPAPQGGIARGR